MHICRARLRGRRRHQRHQRHQRHHRCGRHRGGRLERHGRDAHDRRRCRARLRGRRHRRSERAAAPHAEPVREHRPRPAGPRTADRRLRLRQKGRALLDQLDRARRRARGREVHGRRGGGGERRDDGPERAPPVRPIGAGGRLRRPVHRRIRPPRLSSAAARGGERCAAGDLRDRRDRGVLGGDRPGHPGRAAVAELSLHPRVWRSRSGGPWRGPVDLLRDGDPAVVPAVGRRTRRRAAGRCRARRAGQPRAAEGAGRADAPRPALRAGGRALPRRVDRRGPARRDGQGRGVLSGVVEHPAPGDVRRDCPLRGRRGPSRRRDAGHAADGLLLVPGRAGAARPVRRGPRGGASVR